MKKQPVHRMQKIPLRQRVGAALVMVLCTIVLVVVLALAFMTSVAIERQSAASYASETEVRMLAESAVNLVMAQIRQASEQTAVAWTSQPGLLRTFDANGSAREAFKLYSAATLKEDGAAFNPAADMPGDWTNRPAEFVDLNRPVVTPRSGSMQTNYPILDPRGVGTIDGLSISNSPYGAAMPVQWIYVLKDGTMTNSTGMTKDNPPVARIAFWTDDESCKLNINTASEGAFWDSPKASTPDEVRMARNQPGQREYQAYPGHPATTSLSPALYRYFNAVTPLSRTNTASGVSFPEVLYSMLPRTSTGGSRGGTVTLSYSNGALPVKSERLFSSVDEMAFLPSTNSSLDRQTNSYVTRDVIDQTRFVLTAHSRAPELNLFNLPRITIWPIHQNQGELYRTPFDNLIAFASTINGHTYYFNRANSTSSTDDFSGRNVELYTYLQRLTAQNLPGTGGGNFLAKYGDDRDQILTQIFDYIRCVNLLDSSSGNPSFHTFTTNTFSQTFLPVAGVPQVVKEPGMGQVVPIAPSSGPGSGTRGFGRMATLNRATVVMAAVTNYVNTNAVPTTTNTVWEAGLFFEAFNPSVGSAVYCPNFDVQVHTIVPFSVPVSTNSTNFVVFSGTNRVNVQGSQNNGGRDIGGYDGFAPGLRVHGGGINFYAKTPLPHGTALPVGQDYIYRYPFISQRFTNAWNATNPTMDLSFGKVRAEIRVRDGGIFKKVQTLDFDFGAGTKVTLPLPRPGFASSSTTNAGNPVEVIPDGLLGRFALRHAAGPYPVTGHNPPNTKQSAYWIQAGDIARSVEATPVGIGGDLRLISAQENVNDSDLDPISGYATGDMRVFSAMGSSTEAVAAGYGVGTSNGNRGFGRLIANQLNMYPSVPPIYLSGVPAEVNGVVNSSGAAGDWDTGVGDYLNGPFINKPDDGNAPVLGTAFVPYINGAQMAFVPGQTFSSPSRQMPSAVMFGSLPSGVKARHPWQTLLFSPNPASLYGSNPSEHPGAISPKDHLLLDLFQMPVVEPYAISEPFSTAGKVNMNYQIIPFTGIERKTALHGSLRPVKISAMSDAVYPAASFYKIYLMYGVQNYRYPVNIPETLKFFDQRFATNGVFKSASEICDIPLIPDPSDTPAHPWTTAVTTNTVADFWRANTLTGDNLREQPYAQLYPRLTTKSNTYTVHVWVETLKKIPSTPATEWVEGRDKVTGEFRGSYLIERYLHPADPDIPDYATAPNPQNLNTFYRFRVISANHFNP